jgi:catechol 2,3-dioxygenase-like lactoylglutathione lyase family enzyme
MGPPCGGARAHAITHVGLSVPDIHAAVDWYCSVLGFRVLAAPTRVDRSDPIAADVFGERFRLMYIAQLSSGEGCGLELFQFVEPRAKRPPESFTYWVGGFFHICVVAPDVAALAAQIAQRGGRIRGSRIWEMFADERAGTDPAYLTIYCEDPFGNIIELFSHEHHEVYAARLSSP